MADRQRRATEQSGRRHLYDSPLRRQLRFHERSPKPVRQAETDFFYGDLPPRPPKQRREKIFWNDPTHQTKEFHDRIPANKRRAEERARKLAAEKDLNANIVKLTPVHAPQDAPQCPSIPVQIPIENQRYENQTKFYVTLPPILERTDDIENQEDIEQRAAEKAAEDAQSRAKRRRYRKKIHSLLNEGLDIPLKMSTKRQLTDASEPLKLNPKDKRPKHTHAVRPPPPGLRKAGAAEAGCNRRYKERKASEPAAKRDHVLRPPPPGLRKAGAAWTGTNKNQIEEPGRNKAASNRVQKHQPPGLQQAGASKPSRSSSSTAPSTSQEARPQPPGLRKAGAADSGADKRPPGFNTKESLGSRHQKPSLKKADSAYPDQLRNTRGRILSPLSAARDEAYRKATLKQDPYCDVCRRTVYGWMHSHAASTHLPKCFMPAHGLSQEDLLNRMMQKAKFWVDYTKINPAYTKA